MAMKTSFIFVFGLAGSLAIPAKQSEDNVSLTVASSPLEIKNVFIPEPLKSTISITSGAGKEPPSKHQEDDSQMIQALSSPLEINITKSLSSVFSNARLVTPENGEKLPVESLEEKELVPKVSYLQSKVNPLIRELPKGTIFVAPADGKVLLAKEPQDNGSPAIVLSSPLEINDTFISKAPIVARSVSAEAGKLASVKEPQDNGSPAIHLSSPLEIISEAPKIATSVLAEAGKVASDGFCKVQNLSSEAINDLGRRFNKNGTEVMCAVGTPGSVGERANDQRGVINDNVELDLKGEEDSGVLRGERCLLTMPRPTGLLQSMLGKGLKGMTTEERLAEFRKRLESLRRKPSVDSEKAEEWDKYKDSNNQLDAESKPLFVLPDSPFSSKDLGETLKKSKDEVKSEKEDVLFNTSNLGGINKEEPKIEKANMEVVEEKKLDVSVIPPSPQGQSALGSSSLTQSSGSSGIKLPAQFLSLTRLRERMVDLEAMPDDVGKPTTTGNQVFTNVQPQTSVNVDLEPIPPLKLPEAPQFRIPEIPQLKLPEFPQFRIPEIPQLKLPEAPQFRIPEIPQFKLPEISSLFRSILSPSKIPSNYEGLQSSLDSSSSKSAVLFDQKERDEKEPDPVMLEPDRCSSQSEKIGSTLEGIIAIPKYVRIK